MLLEVGPSVLREFTKSQIVFPNERELLVVQDDRLKYSIMALHQDLMSPSPAGDLFIGHIARGVTSHYLKTYCACPDTRPLREQKLSPADLRRVLEQIETRLDVKPSLDQLAAMLGLSTAGFCRRFKNSTGLPPYQYLLHARVERAKQALRRHEQSLSELALSLGFYDQSQFSTPFARSSASARASMCVRRPRIGRVDRSARQRQECQRDAGKVPAGAPALLPRCHCRGSLIRSRKRTPDRGDRAGRSTAEFGAIDERESGSPKTPDVRR